MNYKPILIVGGEPNSIFFEIFFKSLKYKKYLSPLVLIASHKLTLAQMKKYKFKKNIRLIDLKNFSQSKLDNKSINLINIEYNIRNKKNKISIESNNYIKKSFDVAFKILKDKTTNKLINGPISKKYFLKKKHLGITEYISKKFLVEDSAMLIYNKTLSVCPITTHLPLKSVTKKITKNLIHKKIKLIDIFYRKKIGHKPKIALLGLNPHCESIDKYNEDEKILKPSVKKLMKEGFKISGPYPADTIFLKNNRKKYDVIVGMYHDQVLTPIKTLYEFDAINITLGLPFVRISPDHGPNQKMIGKNLSSPLSLINAIKFLDKN
jgi:4-hydroxythreonine-4-phosphate dehydrogenase